MSKAVLKVVKGEIQEATGSKQLCTGQISDVEVAIHMAMFCEGGHRGSASHRCKQYFQFSKSQHGIAQHPVYLPQAFYITYRAPSDLYIDGEVSLSQEGTTQGDPLATLQKLLD